jgi:hypothetical protein
MYLHKVLSRKTVKQNSFVGVLKVKDKNSRVRSRIRIRWSAARICTKMSWIHITVLLLQSSFARIEPRIFVEFEFTVRATQFHTSKGSTSF